MNRRLLLAVGASALILAGTLPATALGAGPGKAPSRVDISKVDPSFRPMVLAEADRGVTVILQLEGTPAVRVGGTRAAQQSAAKALRSEQASVAAAVGKIGGKVQATYQYAYNGVRVRTTAGKLDNLAAIPGVVAVRPVRVYERTNATGVPYIAGPTTWTAGATGDGVLIAILDTGIDYTHANFGGPGTELAFTGNDGSIVEPGTFPTPKVVGGMDLVGDAYDANSDDPSEYMPVPDGDPIDCGGHGSHVAGTAAGFGVKDDHSTYTGLYDESTIGGTDFTIYPGVAPEAKLFAVKVFGCEGSTDVIVDALDKVAKYNVEHIVDIDVVNMSLGSPFGIATDPDAVATNNLVAAGVTVVASAGNEGSVDYITGAPAVATRAISVAALDAVATLPMATVELPGDVDIAGINQNAYPALPVNGTLDVIGTGGVVELGCDPADFGDATGKIVVVKRGVCAFVDKGMYAEAAGAVGIIVVNRDDVPADALPTFLGYNPEIFDIPMVGTTNASQAALVAADGQAVTLSDAGTQANPTFREIAGFSSSGPRWGDSWLKADVAAPGVSVYSTSVGTGWNGTTYSGTSMAAPMTAGAAALVIQAHPAWSPLRVKAALSNTADSANVIDYTVLRSGSGAIRVDRAARANVIATTSDGTASLNYGYVQATGAWSSARKITITNDGPQAAKYSLASSSGVVKLSTTSVTVPAYSSVTFTATAALSAKTVAGLCSPDQWVSNACPSLLTRSGAVTATPVGAKAGQYALRVPFLLVPRGTSSVTATRGSTWTKSAGKISGRINLTNTSYHAGNADVYALGITDGADDVKNAAGKVVRNGVDVRAAGVQVLPSSFLWSGADPADRSVVFAVNMNDRYSTAAPHEVDILVNTDADPDPEYIVFGYDYGVMTAGAYDGMWASWIYDVALKDITGAWLADAPLNGSTVLLPALASELGLASGDGGFTYKVHTYDGFSYVPDTSIGQDETGVSKAFDAFAPKQSTGQWKAIKGRTATTTKVSTYVGAWFYRVSSVRGWLVVTLDDKNGSSQASIVTIPSTP